mmetsp:Transcript_65244/g.74994  ORF Transcript_65244/g.74994 Transcript_65244/m.74994 type:complete len:98 (+) Transcript_65244:35-328(+)
MLLYSKSGFILFNLKFYYFFTSEELSSFFVLKRTMWYFGHTTVRLASRGTHARLSKKGAEKKKIVGTKYKMICSNDFSPSSWGWGGSEGRGFSKVCG